MLTTNVRNPRVKMRRIASALLVGVATAALATAANAQSKQQAAADVEEVVVTGSRIAGVVPVGSNLISVGRTDIDASGANNTNQLIQQVPQVFNLGISENSRGQSGGSNNITYGSSVNLRGIGPFTTLTIVDGHRAVPQGTTGFAVDPSIMPTIALERVEILADGSSAIYGSDAIAGVVNLIRRRDVKGVEASAKAGWGDSYNERQFSAIAGLHWNRGKATFSFENSYRSPLSGRDRDFFRGDLTSSGGGDYRVTLCSPGNIVVGGVSYAIPAGGVTAANRAALVANTVNRCDNLKIADLIPEQERNSGSLTFDHEISDNFSIYGDAIISKRTFKLRNGAASSSLTVPSTNAFFVAPPGQTPASETVQFSFINDYPQGYSDGFSKAYEGTVGGRLHLPAGWKLDADYTYGRDDDRSISHNVANAAALTAALASNNAATAFNPFGGTNSQTVINNILIGVADNKGRSSLQFWEGHLTGPVFSLPGGEVRAAVGYEGQAFHVVQTNYAGTITAKTGAPRIFNRKVNSVYGEVQIPLFSELNAKPGLHRLEVNVATRYDHYNDVGGTTNPKVGVNWEPVAGVTFRGSYGTSFRAPTISQIYGNTNSLFVQNYSDPTCNCIRQGVARSGANLTLKPETSRTWSFGADYQPDFLPNARFSLTYFDITYDNQVTAYLSDLTLLQREAQFAGTGIIVRNPSAAFIAQQVAETGFTGVLPNPVLVFVEGRNSNLGRTVARGLDFQASYHFSTQNAGDFTLGVNGSAFTKYLVAITPSAPLINQLNNIFNPLTFKFRASLGWNDGPMFGNLFVNFENAYNNNLATPIQRVGAYTTVDLRLGYRLEGPGLLKDVQLALEARNLFDKAPPFVNIAQSANGGGGFDPTVTNPVGRLISIAVSKKF